MTAARRGKGRRPARGAAYETESSERRAVGSVSVGAGAWWSAELTVPMQNGVAFLHVERHGAVPDGYRGGEDAADLSLPTGEVDALLDLLAGVFAHARGDGVLPAASPGKAGGGGRSRG